MDIEHAQSCFFVFDSPIVHDPSCPHALIRELTARVASLEALVKEHLDQGIPRAHSEENYS